MSEDINASAWNSMREDRDYFKAAYERKLADEAKALDAALRLESELREARREWDGQISSANAALAEADRALSAERTARRVMREALAVARDFVSVSPGANPRQLLTQLDAALAAEPGEGPTAVMVPGEVGYVHPQGGLPPEGHPRAAEVKNEG